MQGRVFYLLHSNRSFNTSIEETGRKRECVSLLPIEEDASEEANKSKMWAEPKAKASEAVHRTGFV